MQLVALAAVRADLLSGDAAVACIAGIVAGLIGTPGRCCGWCYGWTRHPPLARAHSCSASDTRVDGEFPPGPYLIAVKHQSMFETLEMLRIAGTSGHRHEARACRPALVRPGHPAYGVIPVDREAGAKALRDMLADGKAAIAERPPGDHLSRRTRVAPGATPPLRPGFAGLYRALGLPVVPVAVDSGRLWRQRAAQAPRDDHLQGRRGDSGRPWRARRSRPGSTPRSTRSRSQLRSARA